MTLALQELLTVAEARQLLRIGRTRQLVQRGVIPSVRLGEKTVRVPAEGLRALIRDGDRRPQPLRRGPR